jgi:opacity protein-like surface antigen
MRLKPLISQLLFLVLLLSMTTFARGQVMHSAEQGNIPVQFYAGGSYWKSNWNTHPMFGYVALGDVQLPFEGKLKGLGVEFEYRDARFRRSQQPNNYRERTIGGGPIYSVPFRNRFRFTGKYLLEYGMMDFTLPQYPTYTYDTRTVMAFGGGAQYRLTKSMWVRTNYEYQFWQPMFSTTKRPTPNGIDFGISYDIHPFRGGER